MNIQRINKNMHTYIVCRHLALLYTSCAKTYTTIVNTIVQKTLHNTNRLLVVQEFVNPSSIEQK